MIDPQDIPKQLALLFHHLDQPTLSAKPARAIYGACGTFDDNTQSEEREPAIHPSTLARCLRQAFMEFENVPRLGKVPPNVSRAGRVGKILHGFIQKSFARTAKAMPHVFRYQPEVRLTKDMPDVARLSLAGSCDAKITYYQPMDGGGVTHRLIGHEIKGLGESEFASISAVREKDFLQASVYQHCLGLEAMWFIYISRRSYEERHIIQRVPDQYWDVMRRRASLVIEHKLMENLPPGTSDSYECGACVYEPVCPHPRDKALPAKEAWKCVERAKTGRPGG